MCKYQRENMKHCMYNAQGFLVCDKKPTPPKERFEEQVQVQLQQQSITLPAGSYSTKCKNCTFANDVLSCTCQNNRGTYSKNSQIEMMDCEGKDIDTDYNGLLKCDLPKGSYLGTCRTCSLKNNVLTCVCMNPLHQYVDTSLNIKHCTSDIANKDGSLVCE